MTTGGAPVAFDSLTAPMEGRDHHESFQQRRRLFANV